MPVMRLQRALARAGVASRREAEELIKKGIVRVNGSVAAIGSSVDPDVDVLEIDGRRIKPIPAVWLALNKPVGYVVTKHDERGRPTVFHLVPSVPGLTYVGRLDINSEGLLLLTTDGAMANRLTHPRHEIERTYRVQVRGATAPDIRRALSESVVIEGRPVRITASRVRPVRGSQHCEVTLTLTEGRNRIVRKICKSIGLRVESLVRLSHGPVRLGNLKTGAWRYLSRDELNAMNSLHTS